MNPDSLAALLLLVVVLTGAGLLGRRLRRRRAFTATVAAEAEVLKVWRDGDGPYCVQYRYTPTGGGEAVTGTVYAGCLQAGLPQPGDRITVLYDPRDPRVSRFPAESRAVRPDPE